MSTDRPGSQPDEGGELNHGASGAELSAQIRFLEDEIALLRRKLTESPRHVRLLEQRLAEASERVSQLTERNAKLVHTLREARSQLLALSEEVDRLAQPPSGYGVYLAGTRTARWTCSPPAVGCAWRCPPPSRRGPSSWASRSG